MALSYREGGLPQFRPPPCMATPPIPPVMNPMVKLEQLTIKLAIKKAQILAGLEQKKQEVIAKAKLEIQNAIKNALGILKNPLEEPIKIKKEQLKRAKAKLDKIIAKKEELERKIQKLVDLYEKYKNLDEVLYAEAMKLIQEQIAKYKIKIEEELAELKAKAKERIDAEKKRLMAKLEIEEKKRKIDEYKKKIDNVKKEYKKIQETVQEIKEIAEKIQYIIEHADEEAMKFVIEKSKPILEEKKKKLEAKLEPHKKRLDEKMKKIKAKIAEITAGIPNIPGALRYQMFSMGVTLYWTGAIINPGPGAPNGIIVLNPGSPIMTFNPTFDLKTQGTDPAEPIRQLIPMLKGHLATVSGLYLLPTGTPPFTPLPWVGYGSTIEWESTFVQPVAMGLKNGVDSLGNLLADNYDRAIKTGFPNAPAIPIPFTSGVAQKIKSMTMIADLDGIKDMLMAMAYEIPIVPIKREMDKLIKKKKELEERIVKPILIEKEKIEAEIAKLKKYQIKVEEYMECMKEYALWAQEQQAAVAYYSDPSNVLAGAIDGVGNLANEAGDLGSIPS